MNFNLHRFVKLALLPILAVVCSLSISFADDDTATFTDPATAGKDFKLQGEYVGVVEGENWGAQLIALGDGKFHCVGFPGGLPGDGYQPGTEKKEADGSLDGDVVKISGDEYNLEISNDELRILTKDGNKIGTLKRVQRESATIGMKPPQGALVLFDGTSADQFENGKMGDDKLLQADCASREKFGDHTLHIEFRTPFKPLARGQARGNSGVYIQSRYELQVLDSFGLSGENNECGGIYQIAKPIVNMCYPPLSWQTYDIDFTAAKYDASGAKTKNARVTIKHNGIVIHDNLELPKGTPGRHAEGPEADGLYLQGHGNPVVYRNIWIVKR